MPQELPFGRMGTGDPIHDQFRQHRHSTLQPLWEEYLQAHQTDSAMITISGGGAGSMSFSVRITKAGELFADWARTHGFSFAQITSGSVGRFALRNALDQRFPL